MEFREHQFDGPYEVIALDININQEMLRGLLYYPPKNYSKPYPLIIYFHGFPQLFPLQEIVKENSFLLEMGYAFMIFNFRGYELSDGCVSLHSQVEDAINILTLAEKLSEKSIFHPNNINILAHDLGGFIALCACSQYKKVNRLLLLSPILDLEKHVYNKEFFTSVNYVSHFLPGHVRGIENINAFISLTKEELSEKNFKIRNFIEEVNINLMEVIIGESDKLTPMSEVIEILSPLKDYLQIKTINDMDHQCLNDEELEKKREEIVRFFEN